MVDEDSGKFQLISDFSDTCFSCFFSLLFFFFVRERFYHVGITVRRRRKHTRIVNNLARLIKENNHV